MKYNFPENIFGGFLQVFLPCVCDESGRPLASILTTRPPHSWMHFTSPHIYIACSIICAYCATATCAYYAYDAHCYFVHAINFSKSAKQLHGIFHLRTSAAGTINPTLCPHLPPTLGVSHPPTHKRATPLVLSNERRGKNLANPLDTLRQILLLTRGKKFMVRSAISPNDGSLPPFPMMWSHLLGGVLFRRCSDICSLVWDGWWGSDGYCRYCNCIIHSGYTQVRT